MRHNSIQLMTAAITITLALVLVPATAPAATIKGKVTAKKSKYLKNTVVYIEKAPSNGKAKSKTAHMDQKNQTFVPFVLPIVKGTSVEFLNNDNTGHNVFTPDGEKYDLGTWAKGKTKTYAFEKEGVYTQLCKMHPSMLAYIIVLQNHYFAVTNDDGTFAIENVPPGDYQLAVWNERRRADPTPIKVAASGADDIAIALVR